jgi:hypothetical protein
VSGFWYSLWSGIVGDVALFGAAWAVLRKHNCHTRWCWRWARHDAGPYRVCRKHHPALPDRAPTAQQVIAAHAALTDSLVMGDGR